MASHILPLWHSAQLEYLKFDATFVSPVTCRGDWGVPPPARLSANEHSELVRARKFRLRKKALKLKREFSGSSASPFFW